MRACRQRGPRRLLLCVFAPLHDFCGATRTTTSMACMQSLGGCSSAHRASIHISVLLPPQPPCSRVRVTVWASCQSLLVKLSEEGDSLARLASAGHETGDGEEAGRWMSDHMKWTAACIRPSGATAVKLAVVPLCLP